MTKYHVKIRNQNSLCGDELELYLRQNGDTFQASFQGRCCTICQTSCSLMMSCIHDHNFVDIERYRKAFNSYKADPNQEANDPLETQLQLFWQNVKAFPVRHKCAVFPWQTLDRAFQELHHKI